MTRKITYITCMWVKFCRDASSAHWRQLSSLPGTRRIYRIDPRGIAAMREWLEALWSAALEAFKDFADAQTEEAPSP